VLREALAERSSLTGEHADVLLLNVQAGEALAYNFPYDNLRLGAIGSALRGHGLSVDYFDSVAKAGELPTKLGCLSPRPLVIIDSLYRVSEGVISAIGAVRASRPEARVVLVGRAAAEICRDPRIAGLVDTVHDSGDLAAVIADGVWHVKGRRPDSPASWAATTPERPFGTLSNGRGVIDVEATKGCTHGCSFCAVDGIIAGPRRRNWQPRHATAVVAEITQQVTLSGIHKIQFVDDNFLGGLQSVSWAASFAEELRRTNLDIRFSIYARLDRTLDQAIDELASVGLVQVHAGLESGSPAVLRRLRKGTTPQKMSRMIERVRDLDIELVASLIVFEPRMTLGELDESLTWLKSNGLQRFFSLSTLIPFRTSLAYGELADRLVPGSSGPSFSRAGYMFVHDDVDTVYRNAMLTEDRYNQITDGRIDELMRARFRHEELLEAISAPQPEELRALDAYRLDQIDTILEDIAGMQA
jgi:radical SAM superfamily enzyme YgiQ (UPF0313 family)